LELHLEEILITTGNPKQPCVQDRDMARATMRKYGKRWAKKKKQLTRKA